MLVVGGAAGVVGSGLGLYAAGATLLGLGPVGWAVLAIGAVALGIYFLFRAEDAKDDDLEAWIKKSCLGTADNTYPNKVEEDRRFGELFKLPLKVNLEWRKGIAGGNLDVDISVPPLANSWLYYELTVTLENGKTLKAAENRLPNGAGLPLSSIPTFRVYESLNAPLYSAKTDGARWHLSYLGLQDEPVKATVLLKYWPNKVENPDIVLPQAQGTLFEITA